MFMIPCQAFSTKLIQHLPVYAEKAIPNKFPIFPLLLENGFSLQI